MLTPWPAQLHGNPANPPLVCLHGFLGRASDWDFLVGSLSQHYHLIFPDLPGHGANLPPLPQRPLYFRALAGGLRRTLFDLGLSSVHLVGYSLGGRTALYFSLRCPAMVRSLVLESASPGLAGRGERRLRRQQDDLLANKLRSQGLPAFLEEWYNLPLFQTLKSQPHLLETLKDERLLNHPGWMAKVLADLSPGRQPSLWSKLPELRAPVLLLAGDLDRKYTTLVEQMAAGLPNARVRNAPRAGHNIHLEQPGWFIEQVSQFIGSLNSFPDRRPAG